MIGGGESYVSASPAFSGDGRRLLVCTGCTVSVFSTSTGMLVTELEGHDDLVTAVVVAPISVADSKFSGFCWTASLDGMICYWDFMASKLVRKVKVGLPINSMVIASPLMRTSNGETITPYAFISVRDPNTEADKKGNRLCGQIQIYHLEKSRRVGMFLMKTLEPEPLTISKSGNYMGITYKHRLYIWSIPMEDFKDDKVRSIKLHHTKKLCTLAFHPSERIVAGGDVSGRVLIWRDFGRKKFLGVTDTNAKQRKPGVRDDDDADSCSTWHWHSSEIKFLHFSSDGAYLFSGGKEGVIVVWQLDTGKRKYKPLLGSPLLFFSDSPDPSISCVSCADNQIHILKMPTLQITKSIAGIKLASASLNEVANSPGEFAFDCSNGLVAIRTVDYCIQFYSLFENIEVSQVQAYERNFHPVDDVTVYVALVALSVDGSLMCTVDVRLPEMGLGGRTSLRFWTCGPHKGEFSLTTIIYEPHSDNKVSSVAFRPNEKMTVSTSYGGNFKIWIYSSTLQPSDGHKASWKCQSVGSYRKKPMTAAAFSADGSLLAVAAETVITMWDPDNNVLVAVIGETISPISRLAFVGTSDYIVSMSSGTKPQLAVWKSSALNLSWSYKVLAEDVCCASDSTHFAVLALQNGSEDSKNHDGVILLFDIANPVPVATWSVKKARGGGIAFVRQDSLMNQDMSEDLVEKDALLLAYINSDHAYVVFNPQTNTTQIGRISRTKQVDADDIVPVGYTAAYGELPKLELKNEVFDIPFVPSGRPWETIFAFSSHVIPPLTKLCPTFLSALLEKRVTPSS